MIQELSTRPKQYRTIWISDLHLGAKSSRPDCVLDFIRNNEAETIYLVGDIIDGWRLKKSWFWDQKHNDVIQKFLRASRKGTKVYYIPGNHDQFARDHIGLKMGDIEVQVKNEEEKAFLLNVLAERDALIEGMRQNVDSMKMIVKDLEIENEVLIRKLEEASRVLPKKQRSDVKELLDHNEEIIQATRIQAKGIEETVALQYQSMETITDSKQFKQAAAQENSGFELLLNNEFEPAIKAFKESEASYPTIKKQDKVLSEYVQMNLKLLKSEDPKVKRQFYNNLLKHHSDKMSEKVKKQFKGLVKEKVQP